MHILRYMYTRHIDNGDLQMRYNSFKEFKKNVKEIWIGQDLDYNEVNEIMQFYYVGLTNDKFKNERKQIGSAYKPCNGFMIEELTDNLRKFTSKKEALKYANSLLIFI